MRHSKQVTTFIMPAIRAAKANSGRHTEYRIRDNRGNVLEKLVLHIFPTGRKVFKVHYHAKIDDRRVHRKIKVGTDQTPLDVIKRRWREIIDALDEGRDPVGDEEDRKREVTLHRAQLYTFANLANDYMRLHSKPRKRTWKDDERRLRVDILPHIGGLSANDVTKRNVIHVIDLKTEKGILVQADRTKALISSIFNWGRAEDRVEHNPADKIRKRSDDNRRERFLSESEIRTLWLSLDEEGLHPGQIRSRNVIRLGLLTAQRLSQIVLAHKSELELDGENPVWNIPHLRNKNKKPHQVPLSRWALKVFRDAMSTSGDWPYVFPGRHHGKPMSPDSAGDEITKLRRQLGWDEDVDFHCIRHTVNTGMAKLQIPKHTRSLILSHRCATADITDRYDHWDYHAEKLEALERWAQHLNEIITGGEGENVRSL